MRSLETWKRGFGVLLVCATSVVAGRAQTFTSLVQFDCVTNGCQPYYASPVQGVDGNL